MKYPIKGAKIIIPITVPSLIDKGIGKINEMIIQRIIQITSTACLICAKPKGKTFSNAKQKPSKENVTMSRVITAPTKIAIRI